MSTRSLLVQSTATLLLSSGLAFAQSAGLGNEDDPDLATPGFVTNADAGVSQELQGEALQEDAAETAAADATTTTTTTTSGADAATSLSSQGVLGVRGTAVTGPNGETLGTVENVVQDANGVAHVVVTPSGSASPRAVPFSSLTADPDGQGLTLAGGAIEDNPSFDSDDTSFTGFDDDAEFQSSLEAGEQGNLSTSD
jgi:hypothetical protein